MAREFYTVDPYCLVLYKQFNNNPPDTPGQTRTVSAHAHSSIGMRTRMLRTRRTHTGDRHPDRETPDTGASRTSPHYRDYPLIIYRLPIRHLIPYSDVSINSPDGRTDRTAGDGRQTAMTRFYVSSIEHTGEYVIRDTNAPSVIVSGPFRRMDDAISGVESGMLYDAYGEFTASDYAPSSESARTPDGKGYSRATLNCPVCYGTGLCASCYGNPDDVDECDTCENTGTGRYVCGCDYSYYGRGM